MPKTPEFIANILTRVTKSVEKLSLGWKIYLSLAAILFPVFALTIFVQIQVTSPLLEEEVRQIGTSVCRSLSTDIVASHLLGKHDELEARLIEATWQQPSIVRLDVLTRDGLKMNLLATNVVEDTPFDFSDLVMDDSPHTELKRDNINRGFWEIIYPIKDKAHRRPVAYIHAEVSLQLVHQVVGIFSRIAYLGALIAIGLLIGLLSYYLRRMIANERRLRKAESENVELTHQLHETQRQLFLNEKLAIMGQLTASFAHEIGTPLNSLSGHLQLLREEIREPAATRNAEHSLGRLEVINSQVGRIEGIVKDFLTSTHTPPQQRQLVDISALVQRITKLVAPRVNGIRANVRIDIPEKLEPLRVVPTDLEQVLLNLTNNAIDALESSPNSRELIYEARCIQTGAKKTLELLVRDTGEGIAPDALKQVLKPFFTTKAPGQGTGLGLTISQRLIKRYGGRLELESMLGKGTTIKVSIPYDSA
ncbi:MAG: GHKL domain-containing protein [Deltaproteobacteria bacterium]|nr:GHKL domain-containing protein [Deltaproteobacteria bacterium]